MKKRRRKKIKRLNHAMKVRTVEIVAVIAILFVVLIGRLVYFGIFKNGIYKRQVLSQQNYDNEVIPYKRGDILDRNGNTLATSQKMYNLVLEPKNILRTKKTKTDALNALTKYMDLDEDKLISFLNNNKESYYSVYRQNLSYSQVSDLKEYLEGKKGKNVVGIVFSEKYQRRYPNKSMASHVLGFVSDGNVGTGGIEQYYNSTLSGVDGRKYKYLNEELEQDSSIVEPENGKTIVSTIDSNIQKIAEKTLNKFEEKYGSKGSSILVMNPNNGEVYAMANSTSFNLEDPRSDDVLLQKYSQKKIAAMTEKQKVKAFNEIWKNPIVSNAFEPGSTYKPFTVAAGLEEGILKGNETYYCDGFQKVGPHTIHCSHRSGHGKITLSQTISLSCNDALMQIAEKEGKDIFASYQRDFNFGKLTGIDLPGEAKTSALLHDADDMTEADLATSSFGQSFNCSMIQMASAFSSLINGGNYYKPHVVKQLRNDKGEVVRTVDATLVKQTVSKGTSDKIKSYMKETVESGTGTKAQLDDYTVGGKTGTAQKIPRSAGTYIVSFCGFAPVEKPQVVVYVVIDEIQKSSQTNTGLAVEMAQKVLKESLKELKVPKSSKK
ncbi:peptidoglycan D,D-transpeptidase FtsI family protein [Anaerostipes faecalis]|uniref:peptidoglycan D,D-transpeptidase FtsI family protein n=1 Tax=Anaerostipes faecalis TaxID=2738446 RepID=UPI003F04DF6B